MAIWVTPLRRRDTKCCRISIGSHNIAQLGVVGQWIFYAIFGKKGIDLWQLTFGSARVLIHFNGSERIGRSAHYDRIEKDGSENLQWTTYLLLSEWSGREDSNLRPTVPKTVALPGCATPRRGLLKAMIGL
jgi:hypothetical protein